MRRLIIAALAILVAVPAFAADPPKTDEEKTLYAIGLSIARDLAVFNLSPAEFKTVEQGISDGFGGKPAVEIGEYQKKVTELAIARRKEQGIKAAAADQAFVEKAAKAEGAVRTDSGLIFLMLSEGSGPVPGPKDMVKVHYRAMLTNGREFGNTYTKKEPIDIKMDGVIKCWSEGLQRMKAGSKARWICPPELAYGETGVGDTILPYATLVFEVQLLEVKHEAKDEVKTEVKK